MGKLLICIGEYNREGEQSEKCKWQGIAKKYFDVKWPSKKRVRQLQDYHMKVNTLKNDRAYQYTVDERLLQKGNLETTKINIADNVALDDRNENVIQIEETNDVCEDEERAIVNEVTDKADEILSGLNDFCDRKLKNIKWDPTKKKKGTVDKGRQAQQTVKEVKAFENSRDRTLISLTAEVCAKIALTIAKELNCDASETPFESDITSRGGSETPFKEIPSEEYIDVESNSDTSGKEDDTSGKEDGEQSDLFGEIGLDRKTVNLMTRSSIPKSGIFQQELAERSVKKLPTEWKNLKIIDKGSHRIYHNNFKTLLFSMLRDINRFCNFVIKRQRLPKTDSQKKKGPHWTCYLKCKRQECPVKLTAVIASADSADISLNFQGHVHHNIRKTTADNISGHERDALKNHIEKNLSTPPSKLFGERLSKIPADVYASGNRMNAGRSASVMQQIKSEVKSPLNKKDLLHEKIDEVASQITYEDRKEASSLDQKRSFYGYVQSLSITPTLKIVLTTEV